MDDLGKDRGQNLPRCRMGCAPRSSTQQIATNCNPLLASEREKFLYFRNKHPSSAAENGTLLVQSARFTTGILYTDLDLSLIHI